MRFKKLTLADCTGLTVDIVTLVIMTKSLVKSISLMLTLL